jgi:hypothetical protein
MDLFLWCFYSSSRVHNRLVVAKLQYLQVQKRRYVEFWRGRVSHEPTKIHPQRFLIKSETTARKTRRKPVKRWVGLKRGPTSF